MDDQQLTLTPVQETMIATLYGRAVDNRSPRPVLGDHTADQAVGRIDYDWRKTGVKGPAAAVGIALRAKRFDDWTAEFLAAQPQTTVLHLGCGLDTRVHRLTPPPSVRWFDVDYPEVIELRQRLLPEPTGDYRMVGASVTEEGWLEEVPVDRPTVAVFEGLAPFLRKEDGKRLIQRICGQFPSGQLLFDGLGTLAIRVGRLVPTSRDASRRMHWGIGDPSELEGWHARLECLDTVRAVDQPGLDALPSSARLGLRVMARIPGARDLQRFLRYQF